MVFSFSSLSLDLVSSLRILNVKTAFTKAIKKYKCHATHQKTGGELFKLTPKTITSLGY